MEELAEDSAGFSDSGSVSSVLSGSVDHALFPVVSGDIYKQITIIFPSR